MRRFYARLAGVVVVLLVTSVVTAIVRGDTALGATLLVGLGLGIVAFVLQRRQVRRIDRSDDPVGELRRTLDRQERGRILGPVLRASDALVKAVWGFDRRKAIDEALGADPQREQSSGGSTEPL
jgi:hypothetical protein